MRLSEAIRLGAMLHPQFFGHARLIGTAGEILATCAVGAAQEAGFIVHVADDGVRVTCPTPKPHWPHCREPQRVLAMVTHLNDIHRWTRERIADWLETIEGLPRADAGTTDVAGAWSQDRELLTRS
jgi:hypothetical protein